MFLVESANTPGKFYSVDPKKPWCTCYDFRFRESKLHSTCKHVRAVREKYSDREDKAKHKKILEFVKKHEEVDAVELIDKFGEGDVDELIKRGELLEKKGKIRILN